MFKGRRSVKLSAANRAWWAISGKKGKGSSRGKDGIVSQPMELAHCLDVIQDFRMQECRRRSPKPWMLIRHHILQGQPELRPIC